MVATASAPHDAPSQANPSKVRTRIVCLTATPPAEREAIVSQMLALDLALYHDSAPKKTRTRYLGLHDEEAWVMTLEVGTRLVGYHFIGFTHHAVHKRRIACWVAYTALLPTYQGINPTTHFPAILYRKYRLRFPFRKVYGLVPAVHPAHFKQLATSTPGLYPFPKVTLQPHEEDIFSLLCKGTHFNPVPDRDEAVMQHTQGPQMGLAEERYWRNAAHPAVQFFLAENPKFRKAQAMVGFFRLHWGVFASRAWRRIDIPGRLLVQWLRLNPQARMRANVALLQQLLGAHTLPSSTLRTLASNLVLRQLAPQDILITQGQPQSAIYLIVRGTLLVHLSTPHGPHTIDQLSTGDVVGEIGALLHIPATATLQAKGSCTLLYLGPEVLQRLHETAPSLMRHFHQLARQRIEMNERIIQDAQ